jgi:DNA-binding NtrC family response regulator
LTIPPLRDRPGDISAIARDTLGDALSSELERVLLAPTWPGNVTDLKATLYTLRILASGHDPSAQGCLVEVSSLLLGIEEGKESSIKEALTRLSQKLATHAYCRADGSVTHAAQLLGLTRNSLRWQLRKSSPDC